MESSARSDNADGRRWTLLVPGGVVVKGWIWFRRLVGELVTEWW